MKNLVSELVKKYEFQTIQNKLNALENTELTLQIGFLGEFSSGKSTLINALLNRKILPAMEQPTSKSIIEIIPDSTIKDIEYYEKTEEGNISPIEPIDFQEIALGRTDGKAVVKVKPSKILKENYLIIDTPGISSIDETDTDITYGYLPLLDGAIICQDINFGSLTDSIIAFLGSPAIRPIVDNFLFVLTKADTKEKKVVQEIRKNVIELLKKKNNELQLGIHDIDGKVVTVSGLEALNRNDNFSLNEFEDAFSKNILNRKRTMLKQRQDIELLKLAEKLASALQDRINNMNLDDEELVRKEKDIKKDIESLEKEKGKLMDKIHAFHKKLSFSINQITDRYLPIFKGMTDDTRDQVEIHTKEMAEEISTTIESYSDNFFKNIHLPEFKYIDAELKNEIMGVLKFVEFAKLFGTMALAAAAGPAKGAENLLEAAGGGVIMEGKNLAETGKKTASIKKGLNALGKMFKKINPIEYVGDFLAKEILDFVLPGKLQKLADNVVNTTILMIKDQLEINVFEPITEDLKQKEENLSAIKKERLNKMEELNKIKEKINEDLTKLKLKLKTNS